MEGTAPDRSAPAADAPPAAPPVPPAPPRKSALAFFSAILGLHLLPALAAPHGTPMPALAWAEIFAFLLPAAAGAAGSNLRPGPYLLLARRPTRAQLGLGFLAGVAGFVASGALVSLWSLLLPARWIADHDIAVLFSGPPWQRALMVVLTALLAPLCEEVAFRGYLQSTLRLRRSDAAALVLGTLLFAAMHLNPVSFPGLLLLGAVFGWLALRAGSVWPAVAAHAANNAISALLAAGGAGGEPPRSAELAGLLGALAIGAAGLGAVLTAYRRATPAPPPAADALALADPASPWGPFRPRRLPMPYRSAASAALFTLGALVLWNARGR